MSDMRIRVATEADASAISKLIIAALRTSNAKDYTPDIIARIENSFSPSAIKAFIAQRVVFVAYDNALIIGTASLDGKAARSVFVLPSMQNKGVGRALMASVEAAAKDAGIAVLAVPSSVTAEQFYSRLGYRAVRQVFHDDERTVVMERRL